MKNLKHLFTTATLFGLAILMLTLSGCGSDNSSETTTTSVITTTLTTTTGTVPNDGTAQAVASTSAAVINIPAGAVFTDSSSNTVTGSQSTTVDYSTSPAYLTGGSQTLPSGTTLAAFVNIAIGGTVVKFVTPGLSIKLAVPSAAVGDTLVLYSFTPTSATTGTWGVEDTLTVASDNTVSFTATRLARWAAFKTSTPPPGKPKGVSATAGNGQVTVTWNAPTVGTPTAYNIYYATAAGVIPGAAGVTKVTVASTQTSAVIKPLTNGTPYYFVVSAVNANGEGGLSSEKTATPDAALQVPASPNGVVLTAGTGTVNVLWNTKLTATSYNIYYAATASITSTDLKSTGTKVTVAALSADPQAATQATDIAGLTAGTVYSFIVTAENSAGESGTQNTPKTATPL